MADDDYWNVSRKGFHFDDEDEQFEQLGAQMRADLVELTSSSKSNTYDSPKQVLLPLSDLISDKTLATVLLIQNGQESSDIVQATSHSTSVPITLKRMVLGRPVFLHSHKSLKSKTQLLDGAIAIGDGNVILSIILFLVQTLEKKLFSQLLMSRPIAVNHYVCYLMTRWRIPELNDVLTMLGKSSDSAMRQYQMYLQSFDGPIDVLMNRLQNLNSNHFSQPGFDGHQCKMLTDYIKLLEWQKTVGISELYNQPVLRSLAFCCKTHPGEGVSKASSLLTLSQQQQISPMQLDWTNMCVQAILRRWEVIETMFAKKDWIGRTTVSTNIPLPKIIRKLDTLGASTVLLRVFLNHISSIDTRLQVAKKHKVHTIVVDCLVQQRDRMALTQYKMALNPQSEEYIYAENALRSLTIKWKN